MIADMSELTIVSKRLIHDAVRDMKCQPEEIVITKGMLKSCSHVYSRYHQYLDDRKKTKAATEQELKRKLLSDEMNDLKNKKQKLEAMSAKFITKADELCVEAEKKGKLDLAVEANALRAKSSHQKEEVTELTKKIEAHSKQLQDMKWID